ncbi:FHA domain-containing protein [Intrasporangium calvum]|uniref:FHA domain-containing protein n=1 Tax=Intrasporangium calvum TaxID=53358 RepID=A0ABT5GJW0_9MICO|nr:FHA domain-containing protein [Intrasporangium calvum]MDC5698533.1 FHA domain-containing protein [Intrasporangium calvum]
MTVTCPNGHQSQSDDYCDVCGSPIESGAAASSAGAPGPTGSYAAGPGPAPAAPAAPAESPSSPGDDSLECPNCAAPNPPNALFCEACGYDFTTGAMPRSAGGADPVAQPVEGATTPAVTEEPAESPAESPAASSSAPTGPDGTGFDWLAEVWVDPDWYQTQEADDPCPSPGLPVIVPLRSRSVLLGRVSQSRNTHPEIDLSSDPGVSRRHAQLTTDGTRWFVEDLGSSNGTFVGPASGPLPDDPISVGPRTELDVDDRLYVGAWSRVVVRRATPEEVEAYG